MRYVHGLGRLSLGEIDEVGNALINIFDESGMIGVVEKNRVNYLLKDHLGSTRVVVDEVGQKRGGLNYSDFGETTTSGDVEDIRYRYTGQEWDEELEEYNYLAREYDPATGRFDSPDPAREGFSPYVYVGNNPINYVDPDGNVKSPLIIYSKDSLSEDALVYLSERKLAFDFKDISAINFSFISNKESFNGDIIFYGIHSSSNPDRIKLSGIEDNGKMIGKTIAEKLIRKFL